MHFLRILVGVFLAAFLVPDDPSSGIMTNSIVSTTGVFSYFGSEGVRDSLTSKVNKWMGRVGTTDEPNWDLKFWTPIQLSFGMGLSNDPMVTLCKLNFRTYANAPHLTPMFKVMVASILQFSFVT